ncbi:hypothetical protein MGU_07935 [Metarhizium guizhouense ARSEF 977]|uniref:4-coumarate-CoA ligase 2 n=1 Tax=Metarhizium guizhouense (strain ARSEF 977) TaxID=1276136 RepID=A0A0B4GCZ1_METGA|nr:hypothetical protein MGU_07935 [Metarhizium guizhouense ARSEF 977]
MLILRMPAPKAILPTLARIPPKPQPPWRRISQLGSPHLRLTRPLSQLRSFAYQPSKSSSEAAKRQAKSAAQSAKNHDIPERILIYHAGTGRIAFLAALKLTSLLLGAFFTLLAAPSYFQAGKPPLATAAVAACGIVPAVFVAWSTAPFVTHVHMHLPAAARASPASLARFVGALPPGARLTLTTMSLVAAPRCSAVRAGDLRAAVPRRRLGLVNYVRDTAADNAARRWYMYRAVGAFYVQDSGSGVPGKQRVTTGHQGRRNKAAVVDTWIWEAVRDKIARRDAPGPV